MRCVDVNVLLYAHRCEAPDHAAYRRWLDDARAAHEPLGLAEIVLSGFLRVATHPRVFREPTPLAVALEFVEGLRNSPAAASVRPGERHWQIFVDLCRRVGAAGNVVPDAFLAALSMEHGARWITADRSFGRFPGLRWEHPLDG